MRVSFVKQSKFQTVGPAGPFVRVFAVGEVVDLPEMYARLVIAQGDATVASDEDKAVKPKPVAKKR